VPGSPGDLVESIYAAALDPEGWGAVMELVRRRFATSAEALYFLDFEPRRVRTVHLRGITDHWHRSFDEAYFTPDNPWCVHSARLHRPGVVRTNERLARLTRDPQILYRSVYYNEWMRPQDFRYTIGNTMIAEQGTVANLTLLRPHGVPTFAASEVRAFERMSVHMTRALQVAVRLERTADQRDSALRAFDGLVHGVMMVDSHGRLLYANAAAEALLRRRAGLQLREGVLRTVVEREQRAIDALLRSVLPQSGGGPADGLGSVAIGGGLPGRPLTVRAVRVVSAQTRYLPARAAALLTLDDPQMLPESPDAILARLFGATPAESRLAIALADGASLRQAAERLGITYETARSYLKVLFRKTDSRRQSQLVARVISASRAVPPGGDVPLN
jgi:DNA-binding CsgD family transcriptional regulator/PAS domain-containing protein